MKTKLKTVIVLIVLTVYFLSSAASIKAEELKRIISLGPTITEKIYLLGLGDRIIGNTTFCNRPGAAGEKNKVGTILEVDVEKILSLDPDIVIASRLTRAANIKTLEKLGIRVVILEYPKNFSELLEQFVELGQLLGKGKKARRIVKKTRQQINVIRKKSKNKKKKSVFIQIGAEPLFTVTRDSFICDFIEFAGGYNIAEKSITGVFSREKVIEADPEFILIIDMEIATEIEKKKWMSYGSMKAVRNNRVIEIDSYQICSPTPVSLIDGIEEIYNILHRGEIDDK